MLAGIAGAGGICSCVFHCVRVPKKLVSYCCAVALGDTEVLVAPR